MACLVLANNQENPQTTPKQKITKRQLNPFQQMSALNTIQRQLQHLNDHIEESHATLDSLDSFARNKDKLSHQLRTIREDLILLRRSLAWLTRFTNFAKALIPNPFVRTEDFSFPSFFLPELFVDASDPQSEAPREKVEITLKDDFQPPAEDEFPPFSNDRFQERMLQTDDGKKDLELPKFDENRTIIEKDIEEEKQVTDEEIAFALPSAFDANFQKAPEEALTEPKTSESFQTATFLLPPIQSSRLVARSMPSTDDSTFSFLPNFEVYRKFRDLSEVPLDKHGFFDMPKSFRNSHSSFEAPFK